MESLRNSALLAWPALALELAVAGASLLVWRCFFSPLSDVPGPFVARFSRLWHIRHIFLGDQNTQLINLHEKHGHFVRIAENEVSVSHPDGIKKILLAQIPKAPWYTFLRLPDWRFEQPMSVLDPKRKTELSRSLAPPYSLTSMLQQEDAISETIELLLGWMDKYGESGEPMNLGKFCTYTAFDVVGEVVFSKKFGFLETGTDVGDSIANSEVLNLLSSVMGFYTPWHRILINPITTDLQLLPMGHLFNTTKEALAIREKNPDARNDISGHWLRVNRDHPERLSIRNVQAQATTNVGAGSDTVSCGLQGFLYHAIRQPSVWARVRNDIDDAMAQGLCTDRVISFGDAQKLSYFQACIKEALRVFNPVPMGLPRVAPKGGVTIGTRTFPEGTILSINPWVIHYSKELWGPHAHEFNPERWLSGNASSLEKYWIPFGTGYNSCPGHYIAKMELSKICSTIVRDYDVSFVDPKQPLTHSAYFATFPHTWPVNIKKRTG